MKRGNYTPTLRHIVVAAVCFLTLHSNNNEFATAARMPGAAGSARPIPVELTDFSNAHAMGEGCRAGEVSFVPMSREDLDAELREWADSRWLETLAPRTIIGADRLEIAQEAWRRLAQIDPTSIRHTANFRSYAAQVVNNLASDLLSGRKRGVKHVEATVERLDRANWNQGFGGEAPDEVYVRQERKALARKALGELPRGRRQILYLMRFEGMSGPEVARRLNLSVHTVYSECALALAQFEKLIKEWTDDSHPRRDKS